MGNPMTDLTVKNYTHKEKRGKTVSKAFVGACDYEKNNNVDPQTATVAQYTRKQKRRKQFNPAIVGSVNMGVVNRCRSHDPASAGIHTRKVGK